MKENEEALIRRDSPPGLDLQRAAQGRTNMKASKKTVTTSAGAGMRSRKRADKRAGVLLSLSRRSRLAAAAAALLAGGAAGSADAMISIDYPLADGAPFFRLNFYAPSDGVVSFDDGVSGELSACSDLDFSASEISAFRTAFDYWGLVLGDGIHLSEPVALSVFRFADEDDNAAAYSFCNADTGQLLVYEGLLGAGDISGKAGLITLDSPIGGHYTGVMHSLPQNDPYTIDLSSVILHEVMHAIGMMANANERESGEWQFVEDVPLTKWEAGLRDATGKPAAPGMTIRPAADEGETSESDFLTDGLSSESGVYFTGPHVEEVLDGALIAFPDGGAGVDPVPGLPVNGWDVTAWDENFAPVSGEAELSHIELQNSLMSHQSWRNWNTPMEAELAMLQDLGYQLDRKAWFGHSIYASGQEGSLRGVVNDKPYYARNAAGTDWLWGAPSKTPWGVGLHIYGSYNDVTQTADLLTIGDYALGIRTDGTGNVVRIAPGAAVRSDGVEGYGILVSYGKNHRVVQQGTVTALGAGGVAARFDFGTNMLGNENSQLRGSYIFTQHAGEDGGEWLTAISSAVHIGLDGALVERYDLTGTLAGRKAAIWIGSTALVREINVMQGASISGDIVSQWDPTNKYAIYGRPGEEAPSETAATAVTSLTFGYAANAAGERRGGEADSGFSLSWRGDIHNGDGGAAAIRMTVAGGTLEYAGEAKLFSVDVAQGATLRGSGAFELKKLTAKPEMFSEEASNDEKDLIVGSGLFTNSGAVAPGIGIGVMTIKGDYAQTSTGRLEMEFSASGETDRLVIDGSAEFASGSTLELAPAAGFYSSREDVTVDLKSLVEVDGEAVLPEDVKTVAASLDGISPTLSMTGGVSGDGTSFTATFSREAGVYSSYAADGEAAAVARAFDRHADEAEGGMERLVATLDFSAPDGSGLQSAYEALAPDVYARAGEAAVAAQRYVTQAMLLGGAGVSGRAPGSSAAPDGKRVFAAPLGGYRHDSSAPYRSAYGGVLAAAEALSAFDSGSLAAGVHAAYLHRKDVFTGKAKSRAEADSLFVGLHGRFDFKRVPGAYAFGLVQASVENADMDRAVAFAGYSDRADADWTAWGGSAVFGGGWDLPLSEALTLGPAAWLDWSFSRRPSVTESSENGAALHVESELYQSLRASLGLRAEWRLPTDAWRTALSASAAWHHECLERTREAVASFAPWRDARFSGESGKLGRDSGSAAVRLEAASPEGGVRLSAVLGGDFGGGVKGVWGGAEARWLF